MKTIEECKSKRSLKKKENTPADDRQKRLEMNRAAAMRSRQKKKQELEQLRRQVEQLNSAKALLEIKLQQYEALLQASYRDNTLLKAHINHILTENASLRNHVRCSN